MRVLVTGIGGFVGPVVAAALRAAGHEVLGLTPPAPPSPRLAALGLPVAALHAGDVTDSEALRRLLATARPDAVVHLAGLTFAPAAERDPVEAYRVNVGGLLGLLGAVRGETPK